jgi:hypothetical protein
MKIINQVKIAASKLSTLNNLCETGLDLSFENFVRVIPAIYATG